MYALPAFAGQLTADDRVTGWAPYHEKLYDAVSHILTLTLTKSSIAQTANSFPRLHNIDIVYIISFPQLPRLPHTALTVLTFDVTVMMIFSSDDEFESLRKLNRQRVMKLFYLYCEYST